MVVIDEVLLVDLVLERKEVAASHCSVHVDLLSVKSSYKSIVVEVSFEVPHPI